MTSCLPHDPSFIQVDPIHRLSLLKPLQTTVHGLVLSLALHNDLGTRIARDNLTVTVGWSFQDGTPPGQFALGGGKNVGNGPQTNKWSQAGVSISQFDVSRIVVPIVRRGAAVPARGGLGGRKPGWGGHGFAGADVEIDPLPLATLAITASPTPLVAVSQLWEPEQQQQQHPPLDWIMPLRIQFPANSDFPLLSRPICVARSSAPIWIAEPSAFVHKPLGSSVWDAALVLAGHLTTSPLLSSSTTVVELGAGCGFLGQVLAALPSPPKRTILTDLPDVVDPYMCDNTRALPNVTCATYCWGDPWPADIVPDAHVGAQGENAVIVGSDITYNESLYPVLLATLTGLRAKWPRARVVIAFKRRSSDGEKEFLGRFHEQVVQRLNEAGHVEWGLGVVARTAGQVYVVEAGPL